MISLWNRLGRFSIHYCYFIVFLKRMKTSFRNPPLVSDAITWVIGYFILWIPFKYSSAFLIYYWEKGIVHKWIYKFIFLTPITLHNFVWVQRNYEGKIWISQFSIRDNLVTDLLFLDKYRHVLFLCLNIIA